MPKFAAWAACVPGRTKVSRSYNLPCSRKVPSVSRALNRAVDLRNVCACKRTDVGSFPGLDGSCSRSFPGCISQVIVFRAGVSVAGEVLQRARTERFTSSRTLERDSAFAAVREHSGFRHELNHARNLEQESRRAFEEASRPVL